MPHFKIHHWMITEIGLKGNELLTYAIIYDNSTIKSSVHSATINGIAKTLNVNISTVYKAIESLIFKKLVEVKIINHKMDYVYRAFLKR